MMAGTLVTGAPEVQGGSCRGPNGTSGDDLGDESSVSGSITQLKDFMMAKYLISFPARAMAVPSDEMAAVGEAARQVIRDAKVAGVYVFGGGINTCVAPVLVAPDGSFTRETYPETKEFDGGFCVLELPSRDAALLWASKIAVACRCSQELREFGYDPES